MSVQRVTPAEAAALMAAEGYLYLDVRSVPEFEAGHPEGAYNIPLLHRSGFGMLPNLHFLEECTRAFSRETRLVVGCQAGGRSLQAAMMLAAAGYTVVDQRCGFGGAPAPGGQMEPGWREAGLPVAREAPPDHTYTGLAGKQP